MAVRAEAETPQTVCVASVPASRTLPSGRTDCPGQRGMTPQSGTDDDVMMGQGQQEGSPHGRVLSIVVMGRVVSWGPLNTNAFPFLSRTEFTPQIPMLACSHFPLVNSSTARAGPLPIKNAINATSAPERLADMVPS